jgi:hypothetical protein
MFKSHEIVAQDMDIKKRLLLIITILTKQMVQIQAQSILTIQTIRMTTAITIIGTTLIHQ